jgi:hypothetical protein
MAAITPIKVNCCTRLRNWCRSNGVQTIDTAVTTIENLAPAIETVETLITGNTVAATVTQAAITGVATIQTATNNATSIQEATTADVAAAIKAYQTIKTTVNNNATPAIILKSNSSS